jgi:hypothetical protein
MKLGRDVEGNGSGLRHNPSICLQRLRKISTFSVRIADISAEVRTPSEYASRDFSYTWILNIQIFVVIVTASFTVNAMCSSTKTEVSHLLLNYLSCVNASSLMNF